MKCGKNVEDPHNFCPECMAEMEKYPVKPGTVVRLPQRPNTQVDKKRQQKYRPLRKSADQISSLRTRTHWLLVALIVTFLCFCTLLFLVLWLVDWRGYFDLPFFLN